MFDSAIVEAIDLLSHRTPETKQREKASNEKIPADFERLGLETHIMQRAPFEALVVFDKETILTGYGTTQKTIRRAALIGNISDITDSKAVCVLTDYKKKKKIGKTLIIGESELSDLSSGTDFIEMIDHQ